jgi:hypothetical protein
VGAVISKATYDLVWQAFTKWTQGELDKGRAVNVAGFGIIGYQQLRDTMRIPFIKLSENFLGSHQLQYKPEMFDTRGVVSEIMTKPAYASIAKSVDVDKGTFQTVLANIFQVTGELLSEAAMVDVDLGELGKFVSTGRQLIYQPYNKLKPAPPQGKQTVKALMDFGPNQQ